MYIHTYIELLPAKYFLLSMRDVREAKMCMAHIQPNGNANW